MPPQDPNQTLPVNPQPPQVPPAPGPQPPVPPQQQPPAPQAWGPQSPYGQPVYPGGPVQGQQPVSHGSGNGMAIAGLILSFIFAPIGLILSIIALRKSDGNSSAKTMSIIGIVVSGIGVLVSGLMLLLVMTTYSGIQQKAKDTQYQTDLKELQSQLEASYASAGSYPTLAQLNDAGWRAQHMVGLDSAALSPSGSGGQLVSGEPTAESFSYTTVPSSCDGTSANPCTSYVLAGLSSDGQKLSYNSLN